MKVIFQDKQWKIGVVVLGMLTAFFFVFFASSESMARLVAFRLNLASLALALHPQASFATEMGNHYFNSERGGVYDLQEAKYYYSKSLEFDPQESLAWYQLSRIDFLNGDFPGALEKANRQIELHGDNPQSIYYLRALIYGYWGKYEEAEADFLKFLEWKPNSWAAHNDLAWVYFQQGKYEEAELIARKGLTANPGNAWLLNILGVSLLNQKELPEARKALAAAAEAAAALTPADWQRAYPGNDPKLAAGALSKMRDTIALNISLAVNK